MEPVEKEITLDEVVVKAQRTSEQKSIWSGISDFFKNLFGKKAAGEPETAVPTAAPVKSTTTTNPQNKMAAGAIVTSVSQAVGGIFSFFSKGKELQIEEENTKQLELQLESTEDIELQKTLRKKLDIQLSALNAAQESDRLRIMGSWFTLLTLAGLVAIVVVQIFRYKREKDKPQAPIIIQ
jgi:plasmid maintenance system killer protein